MALERLGGELRDHTRTVSFILSRIDQSEAASGECIRALEELYSCFHAILTTLENRHRVQEYRNSPLPPSFQWTFWSSLV